MPFDSKYFKVGDLTLWEWRHTYGPLEVENELAKMVEWLDANPRRRKKNYKRFIVGWLNKAHAQVLVAQVNARAYARVGTYQPREVPDYSTECEEIKKRYPDLA